jgi:hypothetical protein
MAAPSFNWKRGIDKLFWGAPPIISGFSLRWVRNSPDWQIRFLKMMRMQKWNIFLQSCYFCIQDTPLPRPAKLLVSTSQNSCRNQGNRIQTKA